MAATTSSLSMPYIQPNQAQKHVTHNEALRILDILVQLAVVADDMSVAPLSAAEGARYIVADAATGLWAGHDRNVAVYETGVWQFYAPKAGWRAYVIDREALVVHDGSDWIELDNAVLQDLETLGLGMAASPAIPFAAKLNAALWTALYAADGGDGSLVQTLNKENTGKDVGFVFQRNFQTLGLLGLFGDDRMRLATSADGTVFADGLVIETATGIVSQPNLPRFAAHTNYDNFAAADTWVRIGLNDADSNDMLSFDAATNLFTAPVDGTYMFGGSLLFKMDASLAVRMSARLVLNGTDVIRGSQAALPYDAVDLETVLPVQALVPLNAGDTVELQGLMGDFSGYFAAEQTCLWGFKVG